MSATRTFQTRLLCNTETDSVLQNCATLFGRTERALFGRLQRGDQPFKDIKREFLLKFGLTGRQFNAVYANLKGKMRSIAETRALHMKALDKRIKRAKSVLKRQKCPVVQHQKKRRLVSLTDRRDRLKQDAKAGRIRLCFGSRKLFRAQYYLAENGYASHAAWQQDWRSKRHNQFLVLGSRDETAGCQSCVATVNADQSLKLRLRLPGHDKKSPEKNLIFDNVRFPYGHDHIVAALGRNLSDDETQWQAITYRFVRDDRSWRVFASLECAEAERKTIRGNGVIGIDLNADHAAMVELDRFGNIIHRAIIACPVRGKSRHQRAAIWGETVKKITAYALSVRKPIVIETLDFEKKKAQFEGRSKEYKRMLSSFAYGAFRALLCARAHDKGIELLDVEPAYTSLIGKHKFAARYGLSSHQAAAMAIGRRKMGLSERLPCQLYGTLDASVRKRCRHVLGLWAEVLQQIQAAHAAQKRQGRSGRQKPPDVSIRPASPSQVGPPECDLPF